MPASRYSGRRRLAAGNQQPARWLSVLGNDSRLHHAPNRDPAIMTGTPPDRAEIGPDTPMILPRGAEAYDAAWAAILAAIVSDRTAGGVVAKLSLPELHRLIRIVVDGIERRPSPASRPRSSGAQ